MHKLFLKIPWWVRMVYPSYVWRMPANEKTVFLTFDDGPHPTITPWVLQVLKKYNASATFFCIGQNVVLYPEVFQQVRAEGHEIGNHTFSHLNGWQTPLADYLADVKKASAIIDSSLFRPPYGRIKRSQAKALTTLWNKNVEVVMWDVLSADFDLTVSPEACAANVLKHAEPGSIIVFHDSEKAFRNLEYALPVVLENLKKRGYTFKSLRRMA